MTSFRVLRVAGLVVGEPSRDYLWILARDPRLPEATLERIVAKLPELGYEPEKLVRNPRP